MEVIYTMEQVQELVRVLNGMQVQGIENCKLITYATQIIDNPKDTREVQDEPTSTDKADTVHK